MLCHNLPLTSLTLFCHSDSTSHMALVLPHYEKQSFDASWHIPYPLMPVSAYLECPPCLLGAVSARSATILLFASSLSLTLARSLRCSRCSASRLSPAIRSLVFAAPELSCPSPRFLSAVPPACPTAPEPVLLAVSFLHLSLASLAFSIFVLISIMSRSVSAINCSRCSASPTILSIADSLSLVPECVCPVSPASPAFLRYLRILPVIAAIRCLIRSILESGSDN